MNHRIRLDIGVAVLFLALGAVALFVLIPGGVAVPGSVKVAALAPDFWPRVIAMGTLIAAACLLVEVLAIRAPADARDSESDDTEDFQLEPRLAALRTAVLIVALFAFYASLTTLGVVAASVVLMFAMMLFFGERSVWLVAVLSAAIPVGLFLFFRYVASVPIPLGLFGG